MAPEVVFGWKLCHESDLFSVGCVVAELLLDRPLFPSCEGLPCSVYQKTFLFQAVLGILPPSMIERLRSEFPGWFDAYGLVLLDEMISPQIATFLETAKTLEVNAFTGHYIYIISLIPFDIVHLL